MKKKDKNILIDGNEKSAYWVNKCELCKYSSGFSSAYGLYWECTKFDPPKPMFMIREYECCRGKYYPDNNPKNDLKIR